MKKQKIKYQKNKKRFKNIQNTRINFSNKNREKRLMKFLKILMSLNLFKAFRNGFEIRLNRLFDKTKNV